MKKANSYMDIFTIIITEVVITDLNIIGPRTVGFCMFFFLYEIWVWDVQVIY